MSPFYNKHIVKVSFFLLIFLFGASKVYSEKELNLHSIFQKDFIDTSDLSFLHKTIYESYLFSNPDSAYLLSSKGCSVSKKVNSNKHLILFLNSSGISLSLLGNNDSALFYFETALALSKKHNLKELQKNTISNIGSIHYYKGNLNNAILCFLESLKIDESLGDSSSMAGTFSNIGLLYFSLKDYDKALLYFLDSKKIYSQTKDIEGLVTALVNEANVYYLKKDYHKALKAYYEANQFAFSIKHNDVLLVKTLSNIGLVYYNLGEYDSSLAYINKGLELSKKLNENNSISMGYRALGNLYYKLNDYTKAIFYSTKALEIAQNISSLDLIKDASSSLYDSYKSIGNHKKALEMYELYVSTRDSIESEENQREVLRQEYKYEYEKQAAADSVAFLKEQEINKAQIDKQKAEIKAKRNQQYALYGGLLLVLIFSGFIYNRFKISQKQKSIIESQKQTVEEKNKEITDSISYAKRIQSAILPPVKLFKHFLPESFILYRPKDIVAGDFYWLEHKDGKVLFAAADCTGHGVPGAMVSVICNNGLNRSVREYGLTESGKILDKTREIVIAEFEKSEEEVKDGMDVALCSLQGNKLQYAGANNPLWVIRNGEILEIKADKQPIGKYAENKPYTTHNVELQKGDSIYIFTDGYADQFGGEKSKKFKAANFKKLLLSIQEKPMEEQRDIIDQTFKDWKGNLEQIDDMCVIGVRV